MGVVARDSSSLYDELMARGMVAITTGVSRVQVTVIIEYTVPTHSNDGWRRSGVSGYGKG